MAFDLPTFQQSLPFFQGVQGGQGMVGQYLKNKSMRQKNKSAPALTKSLLAQRAAQNELMKQRGPLLHEQMLSQQIANQQAPDLMQSLLAQRGSQNEIMKQRGPLLHEQMLSQQIANQQAPELLDIKKRFAANSGRRLSMQEDQIRLQREKMTALMGNMLTRMTNLPGGKKFFSDNPDLARNMLQGALNASDKFQMGGPQMSSIPPQVGGPQQMGAPQMQGMPQTGGMPQQMGSPPQMGAMPPQMEMPRSVVTDEQVRGAQDATADSLVKNLTDQATRQQKRYSMVLTNITGKYGDKLPGLLNKYVGAQNKPKYLADLKRGEPDAIAFRNFHKVDVPMIANELKRTMGGQSTDQETKLMESIVNPDWWFGDGKQAISQWNTFIEDHKLIEKGIDVPLRDLFKKKQSQGSSLSSALQNNTSGENVAPSGNQTMMAPNGKHYVIPNNDVDAALKAGLRRVE